MRGSRRGPPSYSSKLDNLNITSLLPPPVKISGSTHGVLYSSVALNFMICLVCFFNLLSQNGLYEYLDRFDQY